MGPYVDYNLTSCPLQSRLQHIYYGQPYARVDLNPMPESTLSPTQVLWIWPMVTLLWRACASTNSIPSEFKFRKKWSPIWTLLNQFLSKEIWESIWSVEREICKLVLKLDLLAHGIMESREDGILRCARSSSFWVPRNLSHHMIRQVCTGDTLLLLVKI